MTLSTISPNQWMEISASLTAMEEKFVSGLIKKTGMQL
jgi:hypothetical protein